MEEFLITLLVVMISAGFLFPIVSKLVQEVRHKTARFPIRSTARSWHSGLTGGVKARRFFGRVISSRVASLRQIQAKESA